MRADMSLNQFVTKIVPVTHTKRNDDIVESKDLTEYKYLFLNLGIRSERDIEKMSVLKCIYDLQDSIMLIFCQKEYEAWFIDYMKEIFKFKSVHHS